MVLPKRHVHKYVQTTLSASKLLTMTYDDVLNNRTSLTSSFKYDPLNNPMKSTQQLNVDWSEFQNHTFFNSAEVKTNIAFDNIINRYPFDGTKEEYDEFIENLTGFENWVLEQFPTYKGALNFNGTSYISVPDYAGSTYLELSRNTSGEPSFNPTTSSFSIEMQLKPILANPGRVYSLFQKHSPTNDSGVQIIGFPNVNGTSYMFIVFSSGSTFNVTSNELSNSEYTHLCFTFNRDDSNNRLEIYENESLIATSSVSINMGSLSLDSNSILIGSGTISHPSAAALSKVQATCTIDEFRIFHSTRSIQQQKQFAKRSLFAEHDLRLYYRFNEPPPPLTGGTSDSIVLDSSGRSLHANVTNFTGSVRINASTEAGNPMIYENISTCPVLFPAYTDVISLNTELLTSASMFDAENPNLISRLIPQHYLLAGSQQDGQPTVAGNISNSYTSSLGLPATGQLGSTQLTLTFLYTWAKLFDEIKLFVDQFSNVNYVDYDSYDTAPDNVLMSVFKKFGFDIPPLLTYNDATLRQYIDGENIDDNEKDSTLPLKYIQKELMKRVIINMNDVLKSKGTLHSLKSFLRSVGIDPDSSLRIRQHGGPTRMKLVAQREQKRDIGAMVQFTTSSFAKSPYLSGSRIEPGYPWIRGNFVQQDTQVLSNNENDGLFTSGSWHVECIVKFPPVIASSLSNITQSLCRLCATSSAGTHLISNLMAISSSTSPKLLLATNPMYGGANSAQYELTLPLTCSELFDGEKWNISFGRVKYDELENSSKSKYYLALGKQEFSEITYFTSTSSFINDDSFNTLNDLSSYNVSGTFIAVGKNQQGIVSTVNLGSNFIETTFDGLMSNLRFWSKSFTDNEWKEHIRNNRSTGVSDPILNWNYNTSRSGSFGRLRMDVLNKQEITSSFDSHGNITFVDMSENNNHLSGSGFYVGSISSPSDSIIIPEIFDDTIISPYFDENVTIDKVRVRGYESLSEVESTPWAQIAPVYEIPKNETPIDDARLSIDFSLVDTLNRDIMSTFSDLEFINDALGSPDIAFCEGYPDLDDVAITYFNRLKDKLDFETFFSVFKWFDSSIGNFIEQLLPRKVSFKGTNFVVESHVLERHKLQYRVSEQYLTDRNKTNLRGTLLLQQISGVARKY